MLHIPYPSVCVHILNYYFPFFGLFAEQIDDSRLTSKLWVFVAGFSSPTTDENRKEREQTATKHFAQYGIVRRVDLVYKQNYFYMLMESEDVVKNLIQQNRIPGGDIKKG